MKKPLLLPLIAFSFLLAAQPVRAQNEAQAADVYNKALHLYQKGKWGAAKEYLHQYLAEYSDSPLYITCLYYLGYCYQQLNNTQEAMSIYHKILDEAGGQDAFWAEMAEKRIQELGK